MAMATLSNAFETNKKSYEEDCKVLETRRDFSYRDVSCRITRHYAGYLRGYFDVNKFNLKGSYYDKLELFIHGGITGCTSDNLDGFDCAHFDDIDPVIFRLGIDIMRNATYKDSVWVENHIKEAIDYAFKLKEEQDNDIAILEEEMEQLKEERAKLDAKIKELEEKIKTLETEADEDFDVEESSACAEETTEIDETNETIEE